VPRTLAVACLVVVACGARTTLRVPDGGPRPDGGLACPGTPETCDGTDEDCDGVVDDGLTCLSLAGPFLSAPVDPLGPQPEVRCGEAWYAYGSPDGESANPTPDIRVADGVVVAAQAGEGCGGPYVALIADRPNDIGGGTMVVDWTSDFSDGLPVFGDEPNECVEDGDGSGRCDFEWFPCCTDGVLLGPFPRSGCVTLTVRLATAIDSFEVLDGTGARYPFAPRQPVEICASIVPPAD
jgi:hypothetical protein